ncbi:hypothetical protein [Natrinema sp. 1APR25-10V2]|uniref:hypothetical protein n=1 Tax=Natrinema sp. 1APR25-10V2 TaxID=2951081 RepID=UPI002877189F|nr:hypothetical protein [Natrinema sp. 1APR25-10V2]MDS0478677.1 hypothetical protein [Natrinema sp. 1APR25-10V2]
MKNEQLSLQYREIAVDAEPIALLTCGDLDNYTDEQIASFVYALAQLGKQVDERYLDGEWERVLEEADVQININNPEEPTNIE